MELKFYLLLVILFWNCACILIVLSSAEHKVHNLVLYPDKHSWCTTTAIKQVVGYPGCDSVEMNNNVCVGACFSYSIPRTVPNSPGEVLPYCDSCQPSNTTLKHVTLKCNSGEFEGETLKKRVEIITTCSCMTCADSSRGLPPVFEEKFDVADTSDSLQDVPQLLGLINSPIDKAVQFSTSKSNYSIKSINDTIVNERLLLLLKELNEGIDDISGPNQSALQDILNQVESEHHRVDDSSLADFVTRVEKEGHINIDIEKLRLVLHKTEQQSGERKGYSDHEHGHNAHRHHHRHGPHHSLVLEPGGRDMIQSGVYLTPTLDVESHHLKPALAGSELTYHDNLVPDDEKENTPALEHDKEFS